MIFFDFSSTLHRATFVATDEFKSTYSCENKIPTNLFISNALQIMITEIFADYKMYRDFRTKNSDVIIAVDEKPYWRNEILPLYKKNRKYTEHYINYTEVYQYVEELLEAIDLWLPFRVLRVPHLEADDVIMILTEHLEGKHLILSPDKDLIQAQKNPNVFQYSRLTKKWLTPETKGDDMADWLLKHCVLGDLADNVPKIHWNSEFLSEFKDFVKISEFEFSELHEDERQKIFTDFGTSDVYKKIRFGEKSLEKVLETQTLEEYLGKSKILQKNFDINKKMVLREGIPPEFDDKVLSTFKNSRTQKDIDKFLEFINKYNIDFNLWDLMNL